MRSQPADVASNFLSETADVGVEVCDVRSERSDLLA
jgi:hypothetical protein